MPRGKINKDLVSSIDKIKREIKQKKQKAIEMHNSDAAIAEKDRQSNINLALADNEPIIKDTSEENKELIKRNRNINKQTKSAQKMNGANSKETKSKSKVNEAASHSHQANISKICFMI